MQRENPKEFCGKYIFYDFETDQSTGEHKLNYCVVQYVDGTEFVFEQTEKTSFVNFCFRVNMKVPQL